MHITLLFPVGGAPFGRILVRAALNDAPWQNIRQLLFNNRKRTAAQKQVNIEQIVQILRVTH